MRKGDKVTLAGIDVKPLALLQMLHAASAPSAQVNAWTLQLSRLLLDTPSIVPLDSSGLPTDIETVSTIVPLPHAPFRTRLGLWYAGE